MRRVIDRMVLGMLLCAVALTTSGCFLRLVLGGIAVETLSDEIDLVIASISANASAAVCRESPFTGAVECTYVVQDPEGFLATTTSTAQLISEFGLFGAFIDPLILQVPTGLNGVTNASGTVDDPNDANPPVPLVITTATSFFAQPGTEIFPEPGHVFVIVDLPASIAGVLTTTGKDLTFSFSFQLRAPVGQFSGGLPVKGMFTGKVEVGGQTFFPPMLPCATSFAGLPTITLPLGGPVNLFAQLLGLFAQQNLGCNNQVYNFSSIIPALNPPLVIGLDGIELGEHAKVVGEVASNATVLVGKAASIVGDVLGSAVALREWARLEGNVGATVIQLGNQATVTGTQSNQVTLPIVGPLPVVQSTPGVGQVFVAKRTVMPLQPGSFFSIDTGERAEIRFAGGQYDVADMRIRKGTRLIFEGASIINVANHLELGEGVVILGTGSLTSSEIRFNYGGSADAVFGKNVRAVLTLIAPNALIRLGERGTYSGRIWGARVRAGKGVQILADD